MVRERKTEGRMRRDWGLEEENERGKRTERGKMVIEEKKHK